MSGRALLIATRNAHKLREITEILSLPPGLEIRGLQEAGIREMPEEDALEEYHTFEANALAKARYFARRSGLPTLADDSGLCVDALGGRPGIHSRRFAALQGWPTGQGDEANNQALLALLRDIAPEQRAARYVCALAFVEPDGRETVVHGTAEGQILSAPQGNKGFGYDPIVFSTEENASFGVLLPEEKNRISHRARALRAIEPHLTRLLLHQPRLDATPKSA